MTVHQTIRTALMATVIAMGISSCYYDVEEELYPGMDCDTMNMSYEMDIVPILSENCYECHSQAVNTANITLEGYQNLQEYVNDGRLLGAIKHQPGFSPMPKNAPQLVECEIQKIESWIESGAPNN